MASSYNVFVTKKITVQPYKVKEKCIDKYWPWVSLLRAKENMKEPTGSFPAN